MSTLPLFDLRGQVAIVTGGTGKLGPVWVDALAGAGAAVAVLDLPTAKPSEGYRVLVEQYDESRLRRFDCDITSRESILAARDQVLQTLGHPDVLVNNAGIDQPPDAGGNRALVQDLDIDVVRRMIEVNLLGTFQVTQVVGTIMIERGKGSIVNIGSLYASVSPDQRFYDHFPGHPPFLKTPAYGASKAGVANMTKYFATLWGPRGVRVNTLSPGGVAGGQDESFKKKYSDRVPLGRLANPEDLKGPLVFLASRASAYVTGAELRVDGGFTAW